MKEYKITLQNQWRIGKGILGTFSTSIIGSLVVIYLLKISDIKFVFIFFLLYFLLFTIPQVILHLNYYLINKDDLLFKEDNDKWIFEHKSFKIIFDSSEIVSIQKSISYPLAQNRKSTFPFSIPWDSYYHLIIVLNNGNKIVITNLMFGKDHLEFITSSGKIKIEKNFFRWAKGPSLQKSLE